MSSNSISTSHSPQARELRSGTGSSISSEPRIHVQKKNISASKSRSNMISNTVVSPKVIRRISKKSTGRKIRSNSKTTEGNLTSQAKNTGEIFEADNTIEADRTQTSNINDYSDISNLVIDETIVNLYDDEMELLNKSDDTAEDLKQKRTTRMKKEDVMKYFTRQEDGSLKCNLCPNSANKVSIKVHSQIYRLIKSPTNFDSIKIKKIMIVRSVSQVEIDRKSYWICNEKQIA